MNLRSVGVAEYFCFVAIPSADGEKMERAFNQDGDLRGKSDKAREGQGSQACRHRSNAMMTHAIWAQ